MNTPIITMISMVIWSPVQTEENPTKSMSHPIAKIVFTQDISNISNEELADALQRLKDQTRKLKHDLSTSQDNMTAGSDSKSIVMPKSARSGNASVEFDEIKRNIRLLKKLFDEKKRRQMLKDNRKPLDDSTNNGSGSKAGSTKPMVMVPALDPSNVVAPNPASPSSEMDGALPGEPLVIPKQVVHNIVDAFELGNSLFFADKVGRAIKHYETVPVKQLSAFDRNWLELMVACCHRRQGEFDLAEHSYRNVANDKHGLRASAVAKEWLKYIATKKTNGWSP